VEQGTGMLTVTLSPTSGPVGTAVTITGTHCGDADDQNHAVSFGAGENPKDARVDAVKATLTGQTIRGTYTITAADARVATNGTFFVQCATDLRSASFTITNTSPS
jgi:hypothetical protein